jgi:hypothetical protein
MALKEKFGKLVLLEKLSEGPLGVTYRAARVKASGLHRIVTLLRYSEAISWTRHERPPANRSRGS